MNSDVVLYRLLLAELTNALRNRDGDKATDLLYRLHAVHPDWTERLITVLLTEGLRSAAARHRSGQPT
jgi:hypothetical protein